MLSKKIAREGGAKDFPKRARGAFCPNNLYIAALAVPIVALIPALVMDFSLTTLAILLVIVGMLLFRFFVIFPRVACIHCRAKNVCPNAQAMGLSGK